MGAKCSQFTRWGIIFVRTWLFKTLKTMSDYTPIKSLPITSWAEDDRPREKLLAQGRKVLSDAELLAIVLGSGSRNESAVDLAKRLLDSVKNNLNELGSLTEGELMKFKGIGQAKAVAVVAALELGRRRQSSENLEKPVIKNSKDAFHALHPKVADLPHEEFWMLFLNKSNKITGLECVSAGGVDATIVDSKILFRKALEKKAVSIIICHNHPSGNLNPSQADIDLTRKLKQAGDIVGIKVLDHLIIAEGKFYSFADEGVI